jgi:hypothetical protein
LEEATGGCDEIHVRRDRLHEYRGDVLVEFGDDVIGGNNGVTNRTGRDAGRTG